MSVVESNKEEVSSPEPESFFGQPLEKPSGPAGSFGQLSIKSEIPSLSESS